MPHHIFYSWQSDTDNRIGRSFIQWALDRAIRVANADADVEAADRDLQADRDTANVPGMPPLADTIFDKIDRAAAFLSDLTHVAARSNGERSPNPNVLLEHGYALKSRGWRSLIGVMNTAMGHPDEHPLPFDLRHYRRPILYHCPAAASNEERRGARLGLQKSIEAALRAILDDEVLRAARVPRALAEAHPHDVALLQRYRAQLPEHLRQFLREHSFGTPYRRKMLDPLDEMAVTWAGAEFDFEDPVLQQASVTLRDANRSLIDLINERIHAKDRNPEMGWPKTDYDVRHGIQKGTLGAIADLNAGAEALINSIDAFERVGRSRVRVAAAPPSPAGADQRWEAAKAAINDLAADRVRGGVPQIVSSPSMVLRFVPLAAMDRPHINPKAVISAARCFPPDTDVRIESGSDERQWWSFGIPLTSTANNPETQWLTRFVRPGFIEFEKTIGARIDNDPEIVVDGRALEAAIVEHLERLAGVLSIIGLKGPGLIAIAFRGIEDVVLHRSRPGGRKIRRSELFLPELQVDDFPMPLQPLLREQFDILWQAAGWPDGSPSFD